MQKIFKNIQKKENYKKINKKYLEINKKYSKIKKNN